MTQQEAFKRADDGPHGELKYVPVTFRGIRLVWLRDDEEVGPLIPYSYLGDDGRVTKEAITHGVGYGFVYQNGDVMRLGETIGTKAEIICSRH